MVTIPVPLRMQTIVTVAVILLFFAFGQWKIIVGIIIGWILGYEVAYTQLRNHWREWRTKGAK
jgi:uncharacterized membrane protein